MSDRQYPSIEEHHSTPHGLCIHGHRRGDCVERNYRANAIGREVLHERLRQDEKWGEQNHPDGTGPDVVITGTGMTADLLATLTKAAVDLKAKAGRVTFLDILLEEVLEAAEEDDPAALRTELVQVAAVAAQWVEKIDRDARAVAS